MLKSVTGFFFAISMCFASMGGVNLEQKKEGYYCDTSYFESGGSPTETTEYIYYDRYEMTTDIQLTLGMPDYVNHTQLNSCAPMAGALVITYYDATKPNLLLNFEPGYEYNGKYYFDIQSSNFTDMKEELYDLMGTNSVKPGTSQSQFKNGMTQYVNNHGYAIAYNSCGNSFNINTAISLLQNQQPIVMFLNSYKFIPDLGIRRNDGHTSMICRTSGNGHVLVAYGYRVFNYYKDGKIFRTDKYLVVSFGDGNLGYISVNEIGYIDAAFGIKIT